MPKSLHARTMIPDHRVRLFWSKVDIRDKDECWEWQAGFNSKKPGFQYGCFYHNGKSRLSHRIAYGLHNKVDAGELNVLHSCDNTKCCNPYHLFLGTQKDNMQDCARKGRKNSEKGSERYNAILDEEKVKHILKMARLRKKYAKYTNAYQAKKYGVSRDLINKIIKRRAWKHVEEN